MHDLKKLKIWEMTLELVQSVYELTMNFPQEEKFGLTSQIRRSAVSVLSNIAEGAGRNSNKEFVYFLGFQMDHLMSFNHNLFFQKGLE